MGYLISTVGYSRLAHWIMWEDINNDMKLTGINFNLDLLLTREKNEGFESNGIRY